MTKHCVPWFAALLVFCAMCRQHGWLQERNYWTCERPTASLGPQKPRISQQSVPSMEGQFSFARVRRAACRVPSAVCRLWRVRLTVHEKLSQWECVVELLFRQVPKSESADYRQPQNTFYFVKIRLIFWKKRLSSLYLFKNIRYLATSTENLTWDLINPSLCLWTFPVPHVESLVSTQISF